jgi:hypothetical protein
MMNIMTAYEYIDNMPCISNLAKVTLKRQLKNDFPLGQGKSANRAWLRVHIKGELEKMVNMYDARFDD